MDSLITTFHIDWKIIIAQAINFGVVFAVLYLFALKPLKKLMDEREAKITGGLEDAKGNAILLEKTKNEYESIINKARAEAHTIFQEGKSEAEAKKTEMLEKAKGEVDNMISNGKKVLESEKVKIIEEAKGEIVSLVVKATEKLLESHNNESFEKEAIKQIKNI